MSVSTTSFLMFGMMRVKSGRPSGNVRKTELRKGEQEARTSLKQWRK